MTSKAINIDKIIQEGDATAAVRVLKICRDYAKDGEILLLMDLLAPEGARTYKVTNLDGTTRTIRN